MFDHFLNIIELIVAIIYISVSTTFGQDEIHQFSLIKDTRRVDVEKMAPATMDDATKMTEEATRVTFTNTNSYPMDERQNNGKREVNIGNIQVSFGGMCKEELMEYVNDPFWVRLRYGLFISFWACWFLMLISAIIIIVQAPSCPPLPSIDWWQKPIYQIYPLSFQDSNGDGIGDLKGIESRVNYLSDLGVSAVWLNPIYQSPMKQFGYDIDDHKAIDPLFGNLEDFQDLVAALNSKEIKLIMDFVPNHSSLSSMWFVKSRQRVDPYTNYYIWRSGKIDDNGNEQPPNNWLSIWGGSAWTYDQVRKEYYLHQFLSDQPDLNLRSEHVQNELLDILTFWLDLGVRGFRVDAAAHLYEDDSFRDEPNDPKNKNNDTENYSYLDHVYTKCQPENVELVKKWRAHLDAYAKLNDTEHIFLTIEDTCKMEDAMKMYGNKNEKIADFPLNFELIDNLNEKLNATEVLKLIRGWFEKMPKGSWPNWVLGNHDQSRIANKVGTNLIDGLHMITLMLTGTPITYYGEEIGMMDIDSAISKLRNDLKKNEDNVTVNATDPSRSPMQWSGKPNAGFTNTTVEPWLSLNPNYETGINVEDELKADKSHLHVYKKLMKLRDETAVKYGSVDFLDVDNNVFGFCRVKKGAPGLTVLVNFGNEMTKIDLTEYPEIEPVDYVGVVSEYELLYKFPISGNIKICSNSSDKSHCKTGNVNLSNLKLGPKEAMLVEFVPNFTKYEKKN